MGQMRRPATDPSVHRTVLLGYSVQHRPITAIELGDPDSPARSLITGCIDGGDRRTPGQVTGRADWAYPVADAARTW